MRTLVPLIVLACAAGATAANLAIVNTLPGTFIDISGTGEALPLSGDLEVPKVATIGNDVFPAGQVWVANNGGVGFEPLINTDLAPVNQPLPSIDAFGGGQSLLAYWDDIGNTIGHVYWAETSDRLIVQWDHKPLEDTPDSVTFQIQIPIQSPLDTPIYAQIIFADIQQPAAGGGLSATIGYQDGGAGWNDYQWSCNTAGAVADGTVLTVIPEPAAAAGLLVVLALRRRR